jgi:hypothetical protein
MTLALFQLQKRLPTLKNAPLPPARIDLKMFLAHLMWGASLGIAESELRKSGKRMLDGGRSL